jgi:hypothetical protein
LHLVVFAAHGYCRATIAPSVDDRITLEGTSGGILSISNGRVGCRARREVGGFGICVMIGQRELKGIGIEGMRLNT